MFKFRVLMRSLFLIGLYTLASFGTLYLMFSFAAFDWGWILRGGLGTNLARTLYLILSIVFYAVISSSV